MFEPPIYGKDSPEYDAYRDRLRLATRTRNKRNRYTKSERLGKPNPFDKVPPKPSSDDWEILLRDKQWKAGLNTRTDLQWFKLIRRVTTDPFMRSVLASLIWWNQGFTGSKHRDTWDALRNENYDSDKALFIDLGEVAYLLHSCGYPPGKADAMAFECKDRTSWKLQLTKIYICRNCRTRHTRMSYVPEKCPTCKAPGSLIQLTKGVC